MKKNIVKKFAVGGLLLSMIMMLSAAFVKAQTPDQQQADITLDPGTITGPITPADFSFETVFSPIEDQPTQPLYKTLTASVPGNIIKVMDADESGQNFKVAMSATNFSSGPLITTDPAVDVSSADRIITVTSSDAYKINEPIVFSDGEEAFVSTIVSPTEIEIIRPSASLAVHSIGSGISIKRYNIPFSNFSAVTLSYAADGADADAGSPPAASANVTAPLGCSWAGTNGTGAQNQTNPLQQNCGTALDMNKYTGSGTTIVTDPAVDITESDNIIEVVDSSVYRVGEVIIMGSSAFANLEYSMVQEVTSPTEIRVARGLSGTEASAHLALSGITPIGMQSSEMDVMVAPEPGGGRIGAYSMGLGVKGILEPQLNLVSGNYTGTITFTLYTCPDLSCI